MAISLASITGWRKSLSSTVMARRKRSVTAGRRRQRHQRRHLGQARSEVVGHRHRVEADVVGPAHLVDPLAAIGRDRGSGSRSTAVAARSRGPASCGHTASFLLNADVDSR